MIAENDNLTAEQFKVGVAPSPSIAMIGAKVRVIAAMRNWPEKGQWVLVKRFMQPFPPPMRGFQPVARPIAMKPHPMCPPWDGTRPGMSRGYPVEKPEPKARPSFLRVVE